MPIHQQSIQSLMLRMRFNGIELSTGTGFVVTTAVGPVLITNRHNVTGRHQETNIPLSKKTGAIPNEIAIMHLRPPGPNGELRGWVESVEPLYDEKDQRIWHEHPFLGPKADFVALKITGKGVAMATVKPAGPGVTIRPAQPVSVIGFPFGETAGGYYPIWATGFVASEPTVDYNRLPVFLVDCRTRQGQSGSPVFAFTTPEPKNGSIIGDGRLHHLVGIYSGRLSAESDIGMVWKASAIRELIDSFNPAPVYPGPRSYIPQSTTMMPGLVRPLPGEWNGEKFKAEFDLKWLTGGSTKT